MNDEKAKGKDGGGPLEGVTDQVGQVTDQAGEVAEERPSRPRTPWGSYRRAHRRRWRR